MTAPTGLACPKHEARHLTTQGGLTWCSECGWEAPESEQRPALPPPLNAGEMNDLITTKAKRMQPSKPVATTFAEVGDAMRRRLQTLAETARWHEASLSAVRDEAWKIRAFFTFVDEPVEMPDVLTGGKKRPPATAKIACDVCGKKVVNANGLSIHKSRAHK